MAIFIPGAIIGAISGNLGGINFVQGRRGPFIRKRAFGVAKQSQAQVQRRANFLHFITEWAALDAEQKLTWKKAAQLLPFPRRLGIAHPLSGFGFFMSHNLSLGLGFIPFTAPPVLLTRTTMPRNLALVASAAGTLVLDWDQDDTPFGANLFIFGQRSLTTSPNFFFNSYKLLKLEPDITGHNSVDITSEWDALLGHPLESETISVRARLQALPNLFSHFTSTVTTTTA